MASSSQKGAPQDRGVEFRPSDDEIEMVDGHAAARTEAIEKSLTNLNIGLWHMVEQMEGLNQLYKEFSENFVLQQKLLREEVKNLRVEAHKFKDMID